MSCGGLCGGKGEHVRKGGITKERIGEFIPSPNVCFLFFVCDGRGGDLNDRVKKGGYFSIATFLYNVTKLMAASSGIIK